MMLSSLAYSVREWPDTEVAPDVAPQAVQPLGLQHGEHDEEGAEQGKAQRGNQVAYGRVREQHAAERLHDVADHDGQQRYEECPEDRPQDGAEPADDDHRQVVDRHADLELLVVRDAEVVGIQHARHPGIERRDGECQQLVAENVDADDLGRDVVVADGDERAPDATAYEVHGAHDRDDDEAQQEVVHRPLARQDIRTDAWARHLDRRLHTTADERYVV